MASAACLTTTRPARSPGVFFDLETLMNPNTEPNVAFLPDAATYNPDPEYIRKLLERANISQRGAARVLGLAERTVRNYVLGESEIPYNVQFCLEVLARGGVADAPPGATTWYRGEQRPLRNEDVGSLVVAIVAGELVLGRVKRDGFGITVEVVAPGIDARTVAARALAEYTLLDEPKR